MKLISRTSSVAARLAALASFIVSITGILLLHWDWRQIVVLYWLTNITAGISALIDIMRSDTTASPLRLIGALPSIVIRIVTAVFFLGHYGVFTFVHGFIVYALINGQFGIGVTHEQPTINLGPLLFGWLMMLLVTLVSKLLTPSISVPTDRAMSAPYGRIMVMQFGLVLGVFLITSLNLPAAAALLLVALNFVAEWNGASTNNQTAPARQQGAKLV